MDTLQVSNYRVDLNESRKSNGIWKLYTATKIQETEVDQDKKYLVKVISRLNFYRNYDTICRMLYYWARFTNTVTINSFLPLVKVVQSPNNIYLITTEASEGTLKTYINGNDVDLNEYKRMINAVTEAAKICDDNQLVHPKLDLEHVFVHKHQYKDKEELVYLVAGLQHLVPVGSVPSPASPAAEFAPVPPESKDGRPYGPCANVWFVGRFIRILCDRPAGRSSSQARLGAQPELDTLIERCCKENPSERCRLQELMEKPPLRTEGDEEFEHRYQRNNKDPINPYLEYGKDTQSGEDIQIIHLPLNEIQIPKSKLRTLAEVKMHVEKELQLLSELKEKPTLRAFHDWHYIQNNCYYVIEKPNKGKPLQTYLEDQKCQLPSKVLRRLVRTLAWGLRELHSRGIAHLALGPKYIFVGSTSIEVWEVKIGAIGFYRPRIYPRTVPGQSDNFIAPERRGQGDCGSVIEAEKDLLKADIWSFGTLIKEILKKRTGADDCQDLQKLAQACTASSLTTRMDIEQVLAALQESHKVQKQPDILGGILGKGTYSQVRKCSRGGENYAVKVCDLQDYSAMEYEIAALKMCISCEFIITLSFPLLSHWLVYETGCSSTREGGEGKYIDDYIWENKLYIVTELCDTDLFHFSNNAPLKPQNLKIVARSVAEGLRFLHSKGYAHRDLKPQNILINCEGSNIRSVKLSDLGFAKDSKALASFKGTRGYFAPEIRSTKYTNKVDLWSYGMTLYQLYDPNRFAELICGINSNEAEQTHLPNFANIAKRDIRDTELREVISTCLAFDPSRRPTCEELLKKAYFQEAGGTKIYSAFK